MVTSSEGVCRGNGETAFERVARPVSDGFNVTVLRLANHAQTISFHRKHLSRRTNRPRLSGSIERDHRVRGSNAYEEFISVRARLPVPNDSSWNVYPGHDGEVYAFYIGVAYFNGLSCLIWAPILEPKGA